MKAIYFLGGVQKCKVVELEDLPASARYVCDAEGYSVYDAQDWKGTFYAVLADEQPKQLPRFDDYEQGMRDEHY